MAAEAAPPGVCATLLSKPLMWGSPQMTQVPRRASRSPVVVVVAVVIRKGGQKRARAEAPEKNTLRPQSLPRPTVKETSKLAVSLKMSITERFMRSTVTPWQETTPKSIGSVGLSQPFPGLVEPKDARPGPRCVMASSWPSATTNSSKPETLMASLSVLPSPPPWSRSKNVMAKLGNLTGFRVSVLWKLKVKSTDAPAARLMLANSPCSPLCSTRCGV
mmetsp:Transcript_55290/g.171276  ORF Transcript_55290/g.171276 Transcript_55290/m.171276 type:complete len:218 (-) Transcript_55290:36-689(-)